jgi:hypothetical protein
MNPLLEKLIAKLGQETGQAAYDKIIAIRNKK